MRTRNHSKYRFTKIYPKLKSKYDKSNSTPLSITYQEKEQITLLNQNDSLDQTSKNVENNYIFGYSMIYSCLNCFRH